MHKMEQNYKQMKEEVVSSVAFKFFEKAFAFAIQIVISIILARLLMPEDYGIIAVINVLIVLSNILVEGGFAVGLVQKKELTQEDINTLFTCSMIISIIIYVIIYLASQAVIDFYNLNCSANILRVYGLYVILSAFCSIYNAILSRDFKYNVQFYASTFAVILSGIIGVCCAYNDMGAWALVIQQLSFRTLYCCFVVCILKFFPHLCFCKDSFITVFRFGSKIILSRLISNFYREVYNLIIGKLYPTDVMGYYNKGQQVPASFATATDYSLQSVMFSAYSKSQDDIPTLKNMVRRTMKTSSYILFPMMIGLASVAHPLVQYILTDKWINCVPFFQIACFAYLFQPINSANIQAINALGKSELTLKIEFRKRIFSTLLIVGSVFFNVYVIAATTILSTLFGCILTIYYNQNLLNYSFREQIRDLASNFLSAVFMGGCVFALSFLSLPLLAKLLLQVLSGLLIFIFLSMVTKNESFYYILNCAKPVIQRIRQKYKH